MDRVLVVTGGSRGIGAAVAKRAAEAGYAICINYRVNESAANSVARAVCERGARAITVGADISDERDVVRLFETVDRELGATTHLVNNAGIVQPQMRLDAMDAERLTKIFATNVLGCFYCARQAVLRMSMTRGGRGGVIVNISSRASVLGSPGEYIDYAATKGALDTMTIGLAKEVAGEGIRVNAVRAGIIGTEMHASGGDPQRVERLGGSIPIGRAGDADDVARAVIWLLADQSSYTTGSFIDVSGGR